MRRADPSNILFFLILSCFACTANLFAGIPAACKDLPPDSAESADCICKNLGILQRFFDARCQKLSQFQKCLNDHRGDLEAPAKCECGAGFKATDCESYSS